MTVTEPPPWIDHSLFRWEPDPRDPYAWGLPRGWVDLFHHTMVQLALALGERPVVWCVKQKMGFLQIHIVWPTDTTLREHVKLIMENAKELSLRTCEVCGAVGKRNKGPSVATRCGSHLSRHA